jgi:hypothetical protein
VLASATESTITTTTARASPTLAGRARNRDGNPLLKQEPPRPLPGRGGSSFRPASAAQLAVKRIPMWWAVSVTLGAS